MQNYFNYFTEIEEHFTRRRGSLLLLSTLDWALIETWREAGIPLAAVLAGIDDAFDKYEARRARAKGRLARVNGLAWAAQAVLKAAETAAETSIGAAAGETASGVAVGVAAGVASGARETGFESAPVVRFLRENAAAVESALPGTELVARLRALADEVAAAATAPALEDLDRTLTVLEEKLYAQVMGSAPEEELVALREQAARELAPYRAKMGAVQIRQVQDQFLRKRLFEARKLPRLTLFYMRHDG